MDTPPQWRRIIVHPVGGLSEVGFTADEEHLLVVSISGRGLIDTATGLRVARDPDEPRAQSVWLDEPRGTAEGIGPATGVRVSVVGLWGGALLPNTSDGWSVVVEPGPRGETVVLTQHGDRARWVLDHPITDVRAVGFSNTGRYLIVATASDLALFARDPG
jgi:hypothetical protein